MRHLLSSCISLCILSAILSGALARMRFHFCLWKQLNIGLPNFPKFFVTIHCTDLVYRMLSARAIYLRTKAKHIRGSVQWRKLFVIDWRLNVKCAILQQGLDTECEGNMFVHPRESYGGKRPSKSPGKTSY